MAYFERGCLDLSQNVSPEKNGEPGTARRWTQLPSYRKTWVKDRKGNNRAPASSLSAFVRFCPLGKRCLLPFGDAGPRQTVKSLSIFPDSCLTRLASSFICPPAYLT